MKKLSALLLSFILLGALTGSSKAAEPDLLFGETHKYSVVLRGNTESIVYAHINLTNNQYSTLKEYSFEIPKLDVAEIAGYQVELSPYCSQYDYSQAYRNSTSVRPCLRYSKPNYRYGNYSAEKTQFHKLKFDQNGNKYTVQLPKPIEPENETAFVISYTGKGYVSENLGLYRFNFETLRVPHRIKSVAVAVNVDSELVLEGQRSSVNYNQSSGSSALSLESNLDAASGASLSRAAEMIGNNGTINKKATNLAAGESFSVKGKYAASAWRLNLSKILISILIILTIVAILVLIVKKSKKKWRQKPTGGSVKIMKTSTQSVKTSASEPANLVNPLFIGAGFVSASVIMIGTYLISVLINSMEKSSDSTFAEPAPLIRVIIVIAMILFYLLALFGPAIWLAANKRNWKILIYVLFWEFAWLIVFVVVYQWGLKDIFNTGGQAEPSNRPLIDDCITC